MFKKRPRSAAPFSKREPAYWQGRLFKNAFTYKGRRVEVRNWSVKIQLFGKRKTFALVSPKRKQAANEACRIYQTIMEQGWEGVTRTRVKFEISPLASFGSTTSPAVIGNDVEHWKGRLIHRKYPEQPGPEWEHELSVRIEHARISHFFPLGTSDEKEAASRARHIHQTVVNEGWSHASTVFPRELSLALRWQENPLAWTYTTIHTRKSNGPPPPANGNRSHPLDHEVVLIEPDAGIRLALASCANGQPGFRCTASFASAAEAEREIPRRPTSFVLANQDLPDEPGEATLDALRQHSPELVMLRYSIFEDSDQLFKSTPGGSVVYMLKRTAAQRLFEPIAELTAPVTNERVAAHVRDYFQLLAASLPAGSPLGRLATLTPREHEVLALLSKGHIAKEIADTLGISNWTVQGHVKSIFEKLNVHTRTEAVIKFLQK